MEYIYFFIKIMLLLPFIFLLIIASLKLAKNIQQSSSKYVKIIDRVQLAPNTFISIVKIIDKTYIMVTTNNSSEIVSEITNEIEFEIPNENYLHDINIHSLIEHVRRKMTNEKK